MLALCFLLTGGQEYTMATMLRSLNVDLDVIGYDATEEGWK